VEVTNLRVKETIVEALMLNLEPEGIGDDEALSEKLGIDSVGFLEILTALEEEFDVEIRDPAVNRRTTGTVRQLAELVRKSGTSAS